MAEQPCLRELSMSTPTLERYERHQYVEYFVKEGVVQPRAYTWTPDNDYTRVRVRMVTSKIRPWTPVAIPKKGAVIKFHLDAHLRAWVDQHHAETARRVSNTDYIENLDWIERQSIIQSGAESASP